MYTLCEQLPFTYRLTLYALFTNGENETALVEGYY
jgi:hypothetical protein